MGQSGKYVIQWSHAPEFCLGVQGDAAANAQVVLSVINTPNTTWILERQTNLIVLADNPRHVLSLQGLVPALNTALCLRPILAIPLLQHWNWLDEAPAISLFAPPPKLYIDNEDGLQVVGNEIQVIARVPDGDTQKWELLEQ